VQQATGVLTVSVFCCILQAEQELGQLRGNVQDQQSLTKQEAQRVSNSQERQESCSMELPACSCCKGSFMQPAQAYSVQRTSQRL
jgi:hypothetical protein